MPAAADWLRAWDSQGHHRTEGDEAGTAWLAYEATALGATVSSESFTLVRVDPLTCCLELDGTRIEAMPVFDAPPTGSDGVTGLLGTDIAVAELSPSSPFPERIVRDSLWW